MSVHAEFMCTTISFFNEGLLKVARNTSNCAFQESPRYHQRLAAHWNMGPIVWQGNDSGFHADGFLLHIIPFDSTPVYFL
jgi:hypothetical protein